jgi:predicted nucleic acid-binding protein
MKYTLDASVAMKWVLPEPDTPKAVRLRNEFRQGLHRLIAPDVFVPEVAHGLTKAERRGVIRIGVAERRMLNVINCLPDLYPSLRLVRRAIQISSQARIAVYDCFYVALAEREGCELVTADQKLINSLQPTFPFIISLASLP